MPLPTAAELTDPNATNTQMKQRLGQLVESAADKEALKEEVQSNLLFDPFNELVSDDKSDAIQCVQNAEFTALMRNSNNSLFGKPTLFGSNGIQIRRYFDLSKMGVAIGDVLNVRVLASFAEFDDTNRIICVLRNSSEDVADTVLYEAADGVIDQVLTVRLTKQANYLLVALAGNSDRELIAVSVSKAQQPKFIYGSVSSKWVGEIIAQVDMKATNARADQIELDLSEVTAQSANTAESYSKNTSTDRFLTLEDKKGVPLLSLFKLTTSAIRLNIGTSFLDFVQNGIQSKLMKAEIFQSDNFEIASQANGVHITDKKGLGILSIVNGVLKANIDYSMLQPKVIADIQSYAPQVSADQKIIADMTRISLQKQETANNTRTLNVQKPRKKVNVFFFEGQSYSLGSDSERIISTTNMFGNLKLGTGSTRGNNSGSDSWQTSDYSYAPTGGNVLQPLVEAGMETGVSGMLNQLKFLHNERKGVDNDADHLYLGLCTGVSNTSIEQLMDGGEHDRYNRVRTAMSGLKTAADAAGYDICICGMIWMQGESNSGGDYTAYLNNLTTIVTQINATIKTVFPSNKDISVYVGQMGGTFTSALNMNIQRALVDYCEINENAYFIGNYAHLPAPLSDIHLLSNSYRWFGCMSAKAIDKTMNNQGHVNFRISSVRHRGKNVLVGFNVPHPPIRFENAFIKNVATMHIDKGFAIKDSTGWLYGSNLTVEIIEPTVIKITTSRTLTGAVELWLGHRTYHTGRHNIVDSDPSEAIYAWDQLAGSVDDIASLNGKKYKLFNICSQDKVNSVEY